MNQFLDRLRFFKTKKQDFANGHGVTTNEDRGWEDGYRRVSQHDKIVRSTHGVNCTGVNVHPKLTHVYKPNLQLLSWSIWSDKRGIS